MTGLPDYPGALPMALVIRGDREQATHEAAAHGLPFFVVRREVDGLTIGLTGPQFEAQARAWMAEPGSTVMHIGWGLAETIELETHPFWRPLWPGGRPE